MRLLPSRLREACSLSISTICPILLTFSSLASAAFNQLQLPSLDLSSLGSVGLAGDFDAISLYQYDGQTQTAFLANGSHSIMSRLPNGVFQTLVTADAAINTMCTFTMRDGKLAGIIVGGNFTRLGSVEATGVALFNPVDNTVAPLSGLSGKVYALLCYSEIETVFVGGEFRGGNSSNAIAWVGNMGWANLPFVGFNGPVKSILKAKSGNVIFGGQFDGIGNTTSPTKSDGQTINIESASISSWQGSSRTGFSDPKSIICPTGKDGSGSTWLAQDNSYSSWTAQMDFGYRPTSLRIYNTHFEGRGTKTFRLTALPLNGIMNLTYVDSNGDTKACEARCPLSSDSSVEFQDFKFVNVIGMTGFKIDISEWYGKGAGLAGVQLFQDDIYTYAISRLNEPKCANKQFSASATSQGAWTETTGSDADSPYLTATFNASSANNTSLSVAFQPDVAQTGNYTVLVYTPGCLQDNSCSRRGRVTLTASVTSGSPPITTEIFQTNNFGKYDTIFEGMVDASSDGFRPTVTLTPSTGQSGQLTIVAQKARFVLISTSGGLNGIFEHDPSKVQIETNFTSSVISTAGEKLNPRALVRSVVEKDTTFYVGGNFSGTDTNNFFTINGDGIQPAVGGGLNGPVQAMVLEGDSLYVGGQFNDTKKSGTAGLSNVALYSTTDNTWKPLGAGLNGRVMDVQIIALNISSGSTNVIAFSGSFTQIKQSGNDAAMTVKGFAIWVPSANNWLQRIPDSTIYISGIITAITDAPGFGTYYAGSLSSQELSAFGAVDLVSNKNQLSLRPLGIRQSISSASLRKRQSSNVNVTSSTPGVLTGAFYHENNKNITVLGGHFSLTSTNGTVDNLAFIDGSGTVTGAGAALDESSTVRALAIYKNQMFIGGDITGQITDDNFTAVAIWDLDAAAFATTQAPSLSGEGAVVNSIRVRPKSPQVYVGGDFSKAGALSCQSVCVFDADIRQWNQPGSGLKGKVLAMQWASNDLLIIGGDLLLNDTTASVAKYDAKSQTWSSFAPALEGPVSTLAVQNTKGDNIFAAGTSTDGTSFLYKWDGKTWGSVTGGLAGNSSIRSIQLMKTTNKHASNPLIPDNMVLMVSGNINLPNYGNVSAATYNGTWTPFLLTSSANGGSPTLAGFFSQNSASFLSSGDRLKVGFVVLIALALSLALVFLIVCCGFLASYIRRRREGYTPAPGYSAAYEKSAIQERVPPQSLFRQIHSGSPMQENPPRV